MINQLNLFAQPSAEDTSVKWLEAYLREHPGWHTSAMILVALGKPETDQNKRDIRGIAQASEWIISGQRGYKHLSRATAEEISHFTNWMESQAREMTKRAEIVRKNAHRIFG
jgi:hypothetical protein